MRQNQSAAARRFLAFGRQIDEFDGRKRSVSNAARQYQAMEFAPVGSMARLETRSCGAEHHGAGVGLGQTNGHRGGVIPKAFVVLVCRVVFLVDDHDPQVFEWGEKSASGPHRNRRVAPT